MFFSIPVCELIMFLSTKQPLFTFVYQLGTSSGSILSNSITSTGTASDGVASDGVASDGVASDGIDTVGVETNFSSSDGLGFASDGVLFGYSSLFFPSLYFRILFDNIIRTMYN